MPSRDWQPEQVKVKVKIWRRSITALTRIQFKTKEEIFIMGKLWIGSQWRTSCIYTTSWSNLETPQNIQNVELYTHVAIKSVKTCSTERNNSLVHDKGMNHGGCR